MSSSSTTQPGKRSTNRLELFPHQEIAFRAQRTHDLIIEVGGVGSGKSTSWALSLLDRMTWDTSQMHALFTLTTVQMRAVTRVIYKQLDRIASVRNHERVFNCRPPKEWRVDWEKRGVAVPVTQDRYENVVIWPCGLHLQLGTLHNKSYEQYRGAEWGSVGIDEFTLRGVTRDAFDFIAERARCGDSEDGVDCRDLYGHRHTKTLKGNPPESPDHWTWELLDAGEKAARDLPGAIKSDDPDGYPNLIAGIGPIILIPSRTTDNTRLAKSYVDNQLARLDADTAARRLGGVMRRTREGLVYSGFTRENEHEVKYHKGRTLYVTVDFNNRPIAAGLWHPLNPGEYPGEHERPGIKHVGKFGEVFDTMGGGLQALCVLLLGGGVGNSGAAPAEWRGLLEHEGPVVFFGDGTGLNKNASGQTLWSIVDDVIGKQLRALNIKYSRNIIPQNDFVPARVRSYNAKLCSASGVRSAWIDPRNTHTITDLMQCVWDKSKPDIQKYGERGGKGLELLGHLTDGDGYMFHVLFPLGRDSAADPRSGLPTIGGSTIQIPRPRI
jgi:hypothetical protein